jgi:hypothetical protein
MSVQRIIQESVNKNPLGLKEAFAEELTERVRLALEAKMKDEIEEEESFDLSDYTVEELEDFIMSESNEYDKKHVEHGLKLYRQAKKEGALNSEAEGHVAHTAQKKFGFSSEKAKNFANHVSNHDTVLSYASGPRSSLDRENMHGAIKKSLRKR